MIFFHFSKVRWFFSLKEAILDPKCKTKEFLCGEIQFFVPKVGNFQCRFYKEKKFDNIDFFIFLATDPFFRQFWFSLLISLKDCLYLMCVKVENFSWLLRVASAKTIGRVLFTPPPREISWQATLREIGLSRKHMITGDMNEVEGKDMGDRQMILGERTHSAREVGCL